MFSASNYPMFNVFQCVKRRPPSPGQSGSGLRLGSVGSQAFGIPEVVVSLMIIGLCAVAVTRALLQINRQAALVRLVNSAKAQALSNIQQVAPLSYQPDITPAVIPSILNVGTTTSAVDLGDPTTALGSVTGTSTWTVSAVGSTYIRMVRCRIDFKYYGKSRSYELVTYKAPD
jgi:type II secretory pathway pseudopilin PulG